MDKSAILCYRRLQRLLLLYHLLKRSRGLQGKTLQSFFFARRGVTALVGTGGVAELRVSEFGDPNSGVIEEVFRNSAGQDVGTDQERHAIRDQDLFCKFWPKLNDGLGNTGIT